MEAILKNDFESIFSLLTNREKKNSKLKKQTMKIKEILRNLPNVIRIMNDDKGLRGKNE